MNGNIKIALIADLHSCWYGENQKLLTDILDASNPDVVLFCGDIFDDRIPNDNAKIFCSYASAGYQCFYVSGNHEYYTESIDEIKHYLRTINFTLLEGGCKTINIRDDIINICGIDDPFVIGKEGYASQIRHADNEADKTFFTILMTHRPELVKLYKKYRFDLVVAGHAHGGQWRIPHLINGLYAPNQGVFPRYAGGKYKLSETTEMIVSRGLARETTMLPRIFNPTEFVIINLSRKKD